MVCMVCGNETETDGPCCRFCGADLQLSSAVSQKKVMHRIVNIEQGRPVVETALRKLDHELVLAKSDHVLVLTLIHGYGSSGKGGKIRIQCRKVLDHLVQQKEINSVIAGEAFKKRAGAGKALLKRYPLLEQICSTDFNNPGITIVIL